MKEKLLVLLMAATTLVSSACSKKLDPREAQRLLEASGASPATCAITVVPVTQSEYTMSSYDARSRDCISELVRAGLILSGPCKTEFCNDRFIIPTNRARVHDYALRFQCGESRVGRVVSIVTDDRRARIAYDRTTTVDQPLLSSVRSCLVDVPEAGTVRATRTAIRDDSDVWALR